MRTVPISAALVLVMASAALGQSTHYRRAPGSTLKYRETRTDDVETLQAYGGDSFQKTTRDATYTIQFLPSDSAVAWYNDLREALIPHTGLPRTRYLTHRLGRKHVLRMDSLGRVVTMAGLKNDPEALYSDLEMEWENRFVVLPGTRLAVGSEWRVTGKGEDEINLGAVVVADRDYRYRVTGERLVNGVRALVIEEIGTGSGKLTGAHTDVSVDIQSSHKGTVLFAPEQGLLLRRDATGEMKLHVKMTGGTPVNTTTITRFQYTQELVR